MEAGYWVDPLGNTGIHMLRSVSCPWAARKKLDTDSPEVLDIYRNLVELRMAVHLGEVASRTRCVLDLIATFGLVSGPDMDLMDHLTWIFVLSQIVLENDLSRWTRSELAHHLNVAVSSSIGRSSA